MGYAHRARLARQPFCSRQSDRWQLALTFIALVFLVSTVVWAQQSQDYINATLTERVASVTTRLDKIDSYLTAIMGAVVTSLIAQVVGIVGQRGGRRSPSKE